MTTSTLSRTRVKAFDLTFILVAELPDEIVTF